MIFLAFCKSSTPRSRPHLSFPSLHPAMSLAMVSVTLARQAEDDDTLTSERPILENNNGELSHIHSVGFVRNLSTVCML
jgi:hypothetical protein